MKKFEYSLGCYTDAIITASELVVLLMKAIEQPSDIDLLLEILPPEVNARFLGAICTMKPEDPWHWFSSCGISGKYPPAAVNAMQVWRGSVNCQHDLEKTDTVKYSDPHLCKYECRKCKYVEYREEGAGIRILSLLEAVKLRPGMYGLTQEEADKMTEDEAHRRWPSTDKPPT